MPQDPPGLLLSEPDAAVVEKLAIIERACLAVVAATVLVSAAEWFLPGLRAAFPASWRSLSGQVWCATAICGIAIFFTHPRFGDGIHRISIWLGALVCIGSAAVLIHTYLYVAPGAGSASLPEKTGVLHLFQVSGMPLQAGVSFCFLGLMIACLQADLRFSVFADTVCWLGAVVILTVASAQVVAAFPFFGETATLYTSHQTMLCLFLLAFVALARRARHGVFRIFLGHGTGSHVARVLAPILLLLPFVREGLRGRVFNMHRMPPHYVTALLATLAVGVSYLLLLYLAWRINDLEKEVHELSLRDPLTDLYNLRGFRFLAEQALRQARRSGQPFSVLFIDVDGLKQINDELGHQTGSQFLIQTAEIMKETFREADVMGRIGGDEFAIAGEFSEDAILFAADRLQNAATQRNAAMQHELLLSFSIGHVTSRGGSRESLDEMLASADEAMYQVKRRRKAVLR